MTTQNMVMGQSPFNPAQDTLLADILYGAEISDTQILEIAHVEDEAAKQRQKERLQNQQPPEDDPVARARCAGF